MGLDVYLYRYESFDEITKLEKEYNDRTEALWEQAGRYEDLSDKEKDDIKKQQEEIAEELGLNKDKYGGHESGGKTEIEMDSKEYPDHLFKIGYLRSSYNGGGLDAVLGRTINAGLSEIFGRKGEDYAFQPDWEESKKRAKATLRKFKKYLKDSGPYTIMEVSGNPFMTDKPKSENEAMELFQKERKKNEGRPKDDFFTNNYSNGYGEFYFGDPQEVVGFIPGVKKFLRQAQPCMYVVCKSKHKFEFYTQALEIIIEMCDWVLSQPDKEKYYLHWSG